jgi:hypothetical protein
MSLGIYGSVFGMKRNASCFIKGFCSPALKQPISISQKKKKKKKWDDAGPCSWEHQFQIYDTVVMVVFVSSHMLRPHSVETEEHCQWQNVKNMLVTGSGLF